MDEQSEELRKQYQNKGFKRGTSLKLLVEVDKVLTEGQRRELIDSCGASSLEEFYEYYHSTKKNNVDLTNYFLTLNPSQLEQLANSCEKYLTDEEKDKLKNFYKKFGTGSLNPEDYRGEKNE